MDETKLRHYTPPSWTQSLLALLIPPNPSLVNGCRSAELRPESTCPSVAPQCGCLPSKPEAEAGEVQKGSFRPDSMAQTKPRTL